MERFLSQRNRPAYSAAVDLRQGWERDILAVSVACMLFLFSIFALSTVGLLIRVQVSGLAVILALVVAVVFAVQVSVRKVAAALGTLTAVLASVGTVSFYFDRSWDGNAYHKLSAGLINSGWNPVYSRFDEFADALGRFTSHSGQWAGFFDGYPKASYIIGAATYALTGNIESGKAFSLISLVAAIGIVTVFARSIGNIKLWQALAVALFACVNTVTIGELFTFTNDGFLLACIFCTIFALLHLAVGMDRSIDRFAYLTIFICVCLGINLKFTALVFFGMMAFFLLLFYVISRRSDWERGGILALSPRAMFAFFSVTTISALVILGASSYMHNLVYYGTPFYPFGLDDANTVNPTLEALPRSFYGASPHRQFFGSFVSHVGMEPAPKIPFTFDLREARAAVGGSKIVGGWGIWFSGIFLVAILAFSAIARRVRTDLCVALGVILICTFVPTFFIPYLNNARFWPLPFLIPPFVLLIYFSANAISVKATALVIGLFLVNVGAPIFGIMVTTKVSWEAHREVGEMVAAETTGMKLMVSLGPPDPVVPGKPLSSLYGLIYNLDSAGIKDFVETSPDNIGRFRQGGRLVEFSYNSKGSPIGIFYVPVNCAEFSPEALEVCGK